MTNLWNSFLLPFLIHGIRLQWDMVRALASSSSSSTSSMTPNNDNWKATPCNRICRYNTNVYDGHVCIGCFRDTYEISHWEGMTPQEKAYTLDDAAVRLAEQLSTKTTTTNDNEDGRRWYGSVSETELREQANQWRTLDGQ
jgi:predicted Fe-S protein YdhL (DUF1289 family)